MLQILRNFIILIFLAILISCSSVFESLDNNGMTDSSKVVIAVLLPISGNNANLSTSLLRSLELANKNNLNANIIIKIYDTKGLPAEAKKQMYQAVKDKAKIVIGPLFATETEAIADIATSNNIPIFTLSNDIRLFKTYDNVIMLNPFHFYDTEATIYYAKQQGSEKVAILAPKNTYGDLSILFIKESLKQNQLDLVKVVRYNTQRTNLTYDVSKLIPYLERVKYQNTLKAIKNHEEGNNLTAPEMPKLNFDTLIIADEGKRLSLLTSYFPIVDLDYKNLTILGNSQWDSNLVRSNNVLQNAYYVSKIESPENTSFYQEYLTYYKTPPHHLDYTIYDALVLASALIYQDSEANIVIATNLTQIYNKQIKNGVIAPFYINQNKIKSQAVLIKQVQRYKPVTITTLKPQEFLKIKSYKELLNRADKEVKKAESK